jgi:hypothetical protein
METKDFVVKIRGKAEEWSILTCFDVFHIFCEVKIYDGYRWIYMKNITKIYHLAI